MANERGRIVIGATTLIFTLVKESIALRTGLMGANVPTASSAGNTQAAVRGRARVVTIEGFKVGSQSDIEAFLLTIETWANGNLDLQTTGKYYPMFHPNNTGGFNTQMSYWEVMARDLEWDYIDDVPGRIKFTIVLSEGSKTGYLSALGGTS